MKITYYNEVGVIDPGSTDERSLSYQGFALKQIMENQKVLMEKLLEIQKAIGRCSIF